jgi:hypothetical protein
LFGDSIPQNITNKLLEIFNSPAAFIVTMGVCLSFVLSYLSETIYWVYRGLGLPESFSYFEQQKATKLSNEIQSLVDLISTAEQEGIDSDDPELIEMETRRDELSEDYLNTFPPLDEILPTRFGNLLATAEYYPKLRYNIDAIQMWPRLRHVIPAENMIKIDQINHEMAFLINSSLLSVGLGLVSWLISVLQVFRGIANIITALFQSPRILFLTFISSLGTVLIFIILGFGFLVISWFFYQLSIPIASRYAEMYRCAFDLFRFKLSEQLRFGCPESTDKEANHWAIIHACLNSEPGAVPVAVPYKHPPLKEEDKS